MIHKQFSSGFVYCHQWSNEIKAYNKILSGVFMRLRNLIPTNAKLMLFKTAILPHLTYCHLVWHFCRASDSRKIEWMKERSLRAVFRNNVSYLELLKRAELPSLQSRRLQEICVLMYKAKNSCPPYISDIFIKHRSKYNSRQSDFSAARYNTVTYGKHFFRHLGPNLWGKLSPDLREVTTLKCFKHN